MTRVLLFRAGFASSLYAVIHHILEVCHYEWRSNYYPHGPFVAHAEMWLVTLVGLIAKNGILIVEFANVQQELGMSKLEAVHLAAATRLRPILMTTVATVVGHFPLTLVTGAGAVARNSIGIVLVGGMTIGTLFTLFIVPSLYVLLAKDHRGSTESVVGLEVQSDPAV